MQHPGVGLAVTQGFTAVSREPVQRAVLYKAAIHFGVEGGFECQRHRPGRVHLDPGCGAGQFRRAGQQRRGLGGGGGHDHMAERSVILAVCILQVPMFFAANQICNAASKGHCQVLQQAPGNGAHARAADPANLLVGRGRQLAIFVVIQVGFPLASPTFGLPVLNLIDKTPVAGCEVLCAQIERTGLAACARHAPAAAAAFIEQVHGVPCLVQGMCSRKPGNSGADYCDRYSHIGLDSCLHRRRCR